MGLPTYYDPVGTFAVGDIVEFSKGKRYRITRKTRTNMAVVRYYWWNAAYDAIIKKLGGKRGIEST